MARKPLIETRLFHPLTKPVLVESTGHPGQQVLKVTGVFQNFVEDNHNGRVYPKAVWDRLLQEGSTFQNRLQSRAMTGVLEHPDDGVTRAGDISHLITEVRYATKKEISESQAKYKQGHPLRLSEGDILGSYECIPTRAGQDLRALLESKVCIGVSSRGIGSTITEGGREIVQEDFDCETWDVVSSPSVERARPQVESADPNAVLESVKDGTMDSDAFIALAESFASNGDAKTRAIWEAAIEDYKQLSPDGDAEDEAEPEVEPQTESNITMKDNREAMKSLKLEAFALARTPLKGLRPTEIASLCERAEDLRYRSSALLQEDARVNSLHTDIEGKLVGFLTEMDEPPIEDEVPPVEDEVPAEVDTDENSDEVQSTLTQAATLIRDNCDEDPEAAAVADELEDLCVAIDPEGSCDDISIPEDEMQALPESARRSVKRIQRNHAALLTQHNRLGEATQKLINRQRSLQESREDGGTITELAVKYNTDMIELGTELFKEARPALFAKHKKRLGECRTFEDFDNLSERLIKNDNRRRVAESKSKSPKGKAKALRENKGTKPAPKGKAPAPAAPKKPAPKAAPAPLTEAHVAVRMLSSARRRK